MGVQPHVHTCLRLEFRRRCLLCVCFQQPFEMSTVPARKSSAWITRNKARSMSFLKRLVPQTNPLDRKSEERGVRGRTECLKESVYHHDDVSTPK